MKNIFKFFRKDKTGEPPYDYNFLYNLQESEYPKYLKKIYKHITGENLNLKHPKTFNEKIQWIKLYGVTPLMRDCTDKVKVRDYVKEKIGEEYLKPIFQIIPNKSHETVRCHCEQVNDNLGLARQSGNISHDILDCHADIKMTLSARNDRELDDVSTYFDQIDFDKLPNSFVIKTNHGCKWHYIIKNKEEYLKNKRLFDETRKQITGWLEQDYSLWGGFEMQYKACRRTEPPDNISGARVRLSEDKLNDRTESEVNCLPEIKGYQEKGISPKILIEPLMREEINIPCEEIHVYYSCSKFLFLVRMKGRYTSLYDDNLNFIDNVLSDGDIKINKPADDLIKQTFVLSEQLSKDFKFVRVDWMIYKNKLYFEELTFTPHSGFHKLNKDYYEKISKLIEI